MKIALLYSLLGLYGTYDCLGQMTITGDWLTSKTKYANYRLIHFDKDTVKSELESSWRSFSIDGGRIFVYCMDHTVSQNKYTSVYEIKSLSSDTLILKPENKTAVEETKRLFTHNYSLRGDEYSLILVKRQLTFMNIEFDSVELLHDRLPFYLTTYYSPASKLSIKLYASGGFRYVFQTKDTLRSKEGQNFRRIQWTEDDKDSINLNSQLDDIKLSGFKNLLNTSNIQNINIERDFPNYIHILHGTTITLRIYRNGVKIHEQISKDFPRTLQPVVEFLVRLDRL